MEMKGEKNTSLPAQIDLPVTLSRLDLEGYSELLKLKGCLTLQLKASDATAKELSRHPARLIKEDGYLHLPWCKAQQRCSQLQDKQAPKSLPPGSLEILEVGLEGCSQKTLNSIVMVIYTGNINVDSSNAVPILKAADFFQTRLVLP